MRKGGAGNFAPLRERRRANPKAGLGVNSVEILLVNDGSSDRTGELARSVPGVTVVTNLVNRGYELA